MLGGGFCKAGTFISLKKDTRTHPNTAHLEDGGGVGWGGLLQ